MKRKKGFTLIELVVVIMILGILAAVAAPKLLSTSQQANENSAKQSLAVIRDAIERWAAENGGKPPATLDLLVTNKLIRAPFPKCPIGENKTDTIAASTDDPLAVVGTGTDGWVYNKDTGEFIINSSATDGDGVAYSTY